jgi:hypothetical protein
MNRSPSPSWSSVRHRRSKPRHALTGSGIASGKQTGDRRRCTTVNLEPTSTANRAFMTEGDGKTLREWVDPHAIEGHKNVRLSPAKPLL